MSNLLIHPKTSAQLGSLVAQPPHALVVVGPTGMGKPTLVREFMRTLLGIKSLSNQPYVLELSGEEGELGIEQIRELRQFTQRKTTGTGTIRRACLLYGADTMTSQAANALLKTLEEPPEDTIIVLTAETETGLPDTIRSRAQLLHVLPVSQTAANDYFGAMNHDVKAIAQAFGLSGGRPGLMSSLLAQSSEHPLSQAVTEAKQLIGADVYARLTHVERLSKDKPAALQVLFGLERIAASLVKSAAQNNDADRLKRAHKTQAAVEKAQQALSYSASTKLVLTDLFINM